MKHKLLSTAVVALLGTIARADVNAALDALHDSGVNLKSLAADVALTSTDDLGTKTTKNGRFVMQKLPDGDTRIRATFTETIRGNQKFDEKHDYLLQGPDLIDRDYAAKKQTVTQVHAPGEKIDLFKLGEGPFPLPIGQTRDEVLKQFTVQEEKPKDPNALAQLKLISKDGTDIKKKFEWIRVSIDKTTKLPNVITTASPNEVDINTATLTNIRVDNAVNDNEFKLEPIKESEWNLVGNQTH